MCPPLGHKPWSPAILTSSLCPCSLLPPTVSSQGRTSSFLLQKPLQCCLQTQVYQNKHESKPRESSRPGCYPAHCCLWAVEDCRISGRHAASTAGDGTSCFLLAWQLRTPTSTSTNILTKMYTYRHLLLLLGCLSARNTAQRAEASRGSISN